MKKIIFIGMIGSGKTTVSKAILGENLDYKKTQSVEILGKTILDTPGEYLERAQLWGALSVTATQADIIGFIQSAVEERSVFPPGYGGSFAKEIIGIVTKIDIATEEQIKSAETKLAAAGANKIFRVSSVTGEGIDILRNYLES